MMDLMQIITIYLGRVILFLLFAQIHQLNLQNKLKSKLKKCKLDLFFKNIS